MANTFTLNVGNRIFGDAALPRLAVRVYPIADSVTKRKLKYLRDTTGNKIITGHAEASATPDQLTARMLPVPNLPDPRDATYDPSEFGLLVDVDAFFFRKTFVFGATEVAAYINNGVVELEDVIAGEIATFTSVGVPYVIQPDFNIEVARAEAAEGANASAISTHIADHGNPHAVTKSQVGLGNVDNTSDANKPVSTAQAAAITTETNRATAAETALQNGTNSTFEARLAAAFAALGGDVVTRTTSGALTVGKTNAVDATSGALAVTLANAAAQGIVTPVYKADASVNAVTITLKLRGSSSTSTLTLSTLNEGRLLQSRADGTYDVLSDHRTQTAMDTAYKAPLDSLRAGTDATFEARLATTIATQARTPVKLQGLRQFIRTNTSTMPRPIDSFDGVLYGATEGTGGKLWKSIDHGDTWTLIKDFGVVSAIQGLRKLPDGEVLLLRRADGLFKSTGWATNPATATWANVVTPSTNAWILPWGVDVSSSGLCVAVEYAIPRDYSHNLWVSTNAGTTWTVKKDLKVMYPDPADVGSTHWHGATIDTFATPERIWATHGDGIHGVYYSDDQGGSFTQLDSTHQPTTPVAAEHGIIAGTDEIPDGLHFIERRTTPVMAIEQLYTARYPSGGLAYQSQRSVRDKLGRVFSILDAQPVGAPALLVASTDGGKSAYELQRWVPTNPAEDSTLSHLVVDDDGYLYVYFSVLDAVDQWWRGRLVAASVPSRNGPEPSDKNSVMSAGAARAEGSGTAYGVGADAGTDRGTATGYLAKATGSRAQARGQTANASATFSDADGSGAVASSSGAIAKGAGATASSVDAVALGNGAQAAQPRSVALGGGQSDSTPTTVTAADQIQIGLRHVEVSKLAADPLAPAANKARFYAVDDGTGVTRLAYRTSSGILVVGTTAEITAEKTRALAAEAALQAQITAGVSFTGETAFPAVDITGLSGATTQTRYVGGTTGGPPTSGTFVAGDWIVTTKGNIWICTTGGTPGTWEAVGRRRVAKTADTSRSATTTLADDPHITLPIAANESGDFDVNVFYEASTTGDIKFSVTAPSGAAGHWGQTAIQSAATSSSSAGRWDALNTFGASGGAIGGAGAGVLLGCRIWGTLRNGPNAGSIALQWAQGTSDATPTIVYTDTRMKYERWA